MTIGATEGDKPDYIADGDLKSPEELRGEMELIHKARLSLREKGTVAGVQAEIEILKQQLEMTHEQLRSLIGIYATLQNEFTQFKEQRVRELNVRIGGGSTSPEDIDGNNN